MKAKNPILITAKSIIFFLVSSVTQAQAYQLPVDYSKEGEPSSPCNVYANKQAPILIKNYGLKFNKSSDELGMRSDIVKLKDWDETNFYLNISVACSFGSMYASKETPIEKSIEWTTRSLYPEISKSTYGRLSGDAILKTIKDAVVFGSTIPQ
ncbi:hypothetical protein [Serratia ureilytica]|uniref:Uncharacterized protein n=1 Tax=Serratia ureilytica TaxID=300181 RepID=A0A9X9BYP0_9GAMM|nr:hypothetical protein [Serratia ureilytica]TXE25878.1 hypothetical protein FOT63_21955 [Serratia ureilytica]